MVINKLLIRICDNIGMEMCSYYCNGAEFWDWRDTKGRGSAGSAIPYGINSRAIYSGLRVGKRDDEGGGHVA